MCGDGSQIAIFQETSFDSTKSFSWNIEIKVDYLEGILQALLIELLAGLILFLVETCASQKLFIVISEMNLSNDKLQCTYKELSKYKLQEAGDFLHSAQSSAASSKMKSRWTHLYFWNKVGEFFYPAQRSAPFQYGELEQQNAENT